MKIYIKNMVCDRCKATVEKELKKHSIGISSIELGEVESIEKIDQKKLHELDHSLRGHGFELILDKTTRLIEQIKKSAIEYIRSPNAKSRSQNFSAYLSNQLLKDYNSLSSIFSEVEGITIEQYVIQQKIERVKELLVYDELTLSEIAHQLNYSSVQHLSTQFKKITGLTPSHFKAIGAKKRKSLDAI
ncbi:MAG: AraC family transcriptional regulator [Cyclobacteriaceae bacterium]